MCHAMPCHVRGEQLALLALRPALSVQSQSYARIIYLGTRNDNITCVTGRWPLAAGPWPLAL